MNCVYNYVQCVWTISLTQSVWVCISVCANPCVCENFQKMFMCEYICACGAVLSCLVWTWFVIFQCWCVFVFVCVWYCIIICMCVSMCVSPLPRWLCSEAGASEICCQWWILIRDHCHIYRTHTHTCTRTQAHVIHLHSHTPPLPHGRTTNLHSHYVSSMLIFSGSAGHGCNTDYQAVCHTWRLTPSQRDAGRFQFYVVIMIFNQNCLKKTAEMWIWLEWLGLQLFVFCFLQSWIFLLSVNTRLNELLKAHSTKQSATSLIIN